MDTWIVLLLVVSLGSALSLIGGIYLLYGKWGARKLQRIAVPFAAGALLAAAFLDLLPEAHELGDARTVTTAVLIGFLIFFILERSLNWFHHHHEDDHKHSHGRRTSLLVIIGDTLHNAIDGMVIGAAFLISPATGIITAVAVALHEIPQEIGDFGLLLAKGMKKKKVLLVNAVSGIITVVAAAVVYGFGSSLTAEQPIILALTAGFFIYIAASDIIPTIHAEPSKKVATWQTLILLAGLVLVGAGSSLSHQYIDTHDHSSSHDHEEAGEHHEH